MTVCVQTSKPHGVADTPSGSAGTPEITRPLGQDAERAYSLRLPRPSRYWGLKSQAIQTQFQGLNLPSLPPWVKPERQKALPGNAVKVWAFLGGFLSFCCFLTGKETPCRFLHQNAPLSNCQGFGKPLFSFLGNSGAPPPHGAQPQTWAWLGSQTRGPRSVRDTPVEKERCLSAFGHSGDLTLHGSTALNV